MLIVEGEALPCDASSLVARDPETFEVDPVRDHMNRGSDLAVEAFEDAEFGLRQHHHCAMRAAAVPDAIAHVNEGEHRVACHAPSEVSVRFHRGGGDTVVDVDVADEGAVVADRPGVWALLEETFGFAGAEDAEFDGVPDARQPVRQ